MSTLLIASRMPRHRRIAGALEAAGHKTVFVGSAEELAKGDWEAHAPRFLFFTHWSSKIPAHVHENHECVIFHMADLPFGRGGSPLQNLVARGFESTFLCALRCVEIMDAGPVYARRPLSLLGTADEILARAADLMVPMILEIAQDRLQPVAQEGEPTVFRRRTREDGGLAGLGDLRAVFDRIRMLDGEGYPPAFVEIGDLVFEFSRASLKEDRVLSDVTITLKEK